MKVLWVNWIIMKNINEKEESKALSRRFFTDAEDFNKYMVDKRPKEIWLDEFMENEPYILLSFNNGIEFRGVYTCAKPRRSA